MRDETEPDLTDDPTPTGEQPTAPPKVIPAGDIFGDAREVLIEFHGERYRLRITRRNKLILQK